MTDRKRGLLLASTTALFWGLLAIGLKIALQFFDAYTIVWLRFASAALMLTGYYSIRNPQALTIFKRPPVKLVGASLLLGINYIGFMKGVDLAGPASAQILIQLGAVTLGALGFIIFKEKITILKIVGFIVAFTGFAFFYFQQFQAIESGRDSFNQGVIWLVVGAWSWTAYGVFNKMLIRSYQPQHINMFIYSLPAILFIPLADFTSFNQEFPWWIWPLMIFLCLNTVIAYGSFAEAFKYIEANQISIITTLNPVITFLCIELMVVFNIDIIPAPNFSWLTYIGAFLILTGAVLAAGIAKPKMPGFSR